MIGQEALPKGSTFLINMFLVSDSLDFDDAILAWKERDPICFFLFAPFFCFLVHFKYFWFLFGTFFGEVAHL